MKDCHDCAFAAHDIHPYCTHAKVTEVFIFGAAVSFVRKPGGLCGPEAALFEERS